MARTIPSTPSVSVLRGLWFVFHHSGQRFALWTSSLTGKEELYLNDTLVTVRRKIALTSVHELAVGESKYSLELTSRSLRQGIFECVLRQNGIPVAVLETEYISSRKWRQSAVAILGGGLLMYAALKTGVSFGWVALGLISLAVVSHRYLGKGSGYVIRSVPQRGDGDV